MNCRNYCKQKVFKEYPLLIKESIFSIFNFILREKGLEKQIEIEDEDGNFDEECEEISESGSSLEEIEEIIEYYLEEGGTEESIC